MLIVECCLRSQVLRRPGSRFWLILRRGRSEQEIERCQHQNSRHRHHGNLPDSPVTRPEALLLGLRLTGPARTVSLGSGGVSMRSLCQGRRRVIQFSRLLLTDRQVGGIDSKSTHALIPCVLLLRRAHMLRHWRAGISLPSGVWIAGRHCRLIVRGCFHAADQRAASRGCRQHDAGKSGQHRKRMWHCPQRSSGIPASYRNDVGHANF